MSTYSELENSIYGGQPVELYRFTHGDFVWTYNSGDIDILYNNETYSPIASGREGEMTLSGEPNKAEINVILPIGSPVSKFYLTGSPEQPVLLVVFRYHYGADVPFVYWSGRVASVAWDNGQANFTCENIFTSLNRIGLRARYQRGCRHILYSSNCGVIKGSYAVTGLVTGIDGSFTVININEAGSFANDYFSAGMLQFAGGYRFILRHTGTALTLASSVQDMIIGDSITIYPGCTHTRQTCKDKFNNIINYGGFPWIPLDDPYSGSIV